MIFQSGTTSCLRRTSATSRIPVRHDAVGEDERRRRGVPSVSPDLVLYLLDVQDCVRLAPGKAAFLPVPSLHHAPRTQIGFVALREPGMCLDVTIDLVGEPHITEVPAAVAQRIEPDPD